MGFFDGIECLNSKCARNDPDGIICYNCFSTIYEEIRILDYSELTDLYCFLEYGDIPDKKSKAYVFSAGEDFGNQRDLVHWLINELLLSYGGR